MADTVSVVNIIPHLSSGETNQDSEPNLAVNPANPQEMVATAFTPSPNLSTTKSPVFYTNDGGATWALIDIIPGTPVRDQTIRFATESGILYGGVLWGGSLINYGILSTNDFSGTVPMAILAERTNDDQPFVQAATVPSGPFAGQDRVYIGSNDHNPSDIPATLDYSLDANVAVPAFTTLVIEGRSVSRDWPQTRPAIHPNGTVYALYYADIGASFDVVIVRDDNWGTGGTPFQALIDTDGKQGIRIVTGVNLPSLPSGLFIGQERVNGDLSITVDPNNSATVYVCWGDFKGGTYTIYVSKSVNSGATWSAAIKTLDNATNPCLAMNRGGRLGLVYQLDTGPSSNQHWQTTLELTHNDFGSSATYVLANTPASAPAKTFDPYIGDYLYMMAVGHSFYGIFSANNTPDLANFPNGVTYQRNANFTTKTLLDLSGNPVSVSIDPFVFMVVPGVGRVVTAIADSGNFGRVCLGSFVDEEVTIDNGGTGQLLITNIISSLPDFEPPSVLTYPIKLDVGDAIEIPIRFAPLSLGPKAATISIFSNDPASPHVIKVFGDAPTPSLSLVIADSGSFGRVCVGHISDQPLVLNNSGHCPVTVFGVASSSAAFLVPQVLAYPLVVGPGDSLDLPIRFAPTSHGPASGTITVTSSDPGSPHIVSVSGDAPTGRLVVTGSLCFGGVKACCRAERTLSICNMGECALNVTSVAFKRKNPHWKLINNPFPATLPRGACLGVVIRYKATEKCPIACELVITSDDATTPVKTLDVMAYTVWDDCCCKKDCDQCGGKGCDRCSCKGSCGICEGAADDCCSDEHD
jgi:Abnormal spindle-like microcephaly-assoc'd, ASPM-SPD-2-Hydin